ncbi:hypothetical protein EHZ19_27075 [Paraburkholderia bannensis]|nr:hypothetical protein [Paraburkholderia bannensis]RQM44767.1 hypothetical protein EHZ19_27075 [Paraburkholderia bannensis]
MQPFVQAHSVSTAPKKAAARRGRAAANTHASAEAPVIARVSASQSFKKLCARKSRVNIPKRRSTALLNHAGAAKQKNRRIV